MKETYWARFEKTGRVKDYLTYKSQAEENTDRYSGKKDEKSDADDYRDGNDPVRCTDWRV